MNGNGRIGLFIPSLAGGGAERISILLAQELQERDWAVDLIVGSRRGPLRAEVPAALNLVDLHAERLRSAFPKLVRYIRHRRPSVLMPSVEHANVVGFVAARAAATGTRTVLRVANTLSSKWEVASSLPQRATLTMARQVYPKADALVACSGGMADDLAAFAGVPRSSIRVIPNSVVGTRLLHDREEEPGHPWLLATDRVPVVLGVGALTAQKNFSLLIRAFAGLRATREARLVILGEGPLRAELEALVKELRLVHDVELPGFVSNPYSFMARCSVYVLSSGWEGLPGVLIEALACGANVVATDCPSGPNEILAGGRYGRLCAVGDEDGLQAAMTTALDDPMRPPPEAWSPYTVANAADEYESLLRGVLSDPSVHV